MNTPMNLTPRHQRFAELIVEGRSYTEAYRLSFNDESSAARCKGSRLATNVNIQNYIQELRQNQMEGSLLTLDEKRRSLAAVVRTPLTAILRNDGSVDMEALRNLPASVVKRFSMKEKSDSKGNVSRSFSITFVDKLRAMELDTKLAGEGECRGAEELNDETMKIRRAEAAIRGRELLKQLSLMGYRR